MADFTDYATAELPIKARDRYYAWKNVLGSQKRAMLDEYFAEVSRNFNHWLAGTLMPSTTHSWEVDPSRFEIELLPDFAGSIPNPIDRLIARAIEAGYDTSTDGNSQVVERKGVPVVAVVCWRTKGDLPKSALLVRPRIITKEALTERFFDGAETKTPAAAELIVGTNLGIDQLACTIRNILEARVCTYVVCDASYDITRRLKEKYGRYFEEAGLCMYVREHNMGRIVIGGKPQDGNISIELNIKDFVRGD